ncbi:MAG: aldo/keto reductase [Chloroflexi bacterium]|nr:MAG: aldo/keto reductase [Chloroflexota bacterium]
MKTKKVPLIEEKISAIGLGCWALSGSDVWNRSDDQDSIKAVQKAITLGVNFFDVAPIYGFGHAEKILGKALVGQRDQVIIASKCGLVWDEQQRVTNNLTADSIFQEIDQSLQRLNTDYIDIYQIHWPDPNTPIAETVDALEQVKAAGKIRYIGVSNFSLELLKETMGLTAVSSFQGLYNMLEHNPPSYHNIPLEYHSQNEILPFCREHGLAFFPYSPLFQGLLTGTFMAEGNFDENDVRASNPKLGGQLFKTYLKITRQLEEFAQEIGKPLTQVAMNWLINQDAVTSIIAGVQNVQHVEENVGSVSWDLTSDMENRISEILAPYKADGVFD